MSCYWELDYSRKQRFYKSARNELAWLLNLTISWILHVAFAHLACVFKSWSDLLLFLCFFNYPCCKQGFCYRVLVFFPRKQLCPQDDFEIQISIFITLHSELQQSSLCWKLQQTFFENVSFMNIRPIRKLLKRFF